MYGHTGRGVPPPHAGADEAAGVGEPSRFFAPAWQRRVRRELSRRAVRGGRGSLFAHACERAGQGEVFALCVTLFDALLAGSDGLLSLSIVELVYCCAPLYYAPHKLVELPKARRTTSVCFIITRNSLPT